MSALNAIKSRSKNDQSLCSSLSFRFDLLLIFLLLSLCIFSCWKLFFFVLLHAISFLLLLQPHATFGFYAFLLQHFFVCFIFATHLLCVLKIKKSNVFFSSAFATHLLQRAVYVVLFILLAFIFFSQGDRGSELWREGRSNRKHFQKICCATLCLNTFHRWLTWNNQFLLSVVTYKSLSTYVIVINDLLLVLLQKWQ